MKLSFPKVRPRPAPPSHADQAPPLMLLSSADGQKVVALGLRWKAVITSDSKKADLLRDASKQRASHVVLAPFLMGMGRLNTPTAATDTAIYSAAIMAASTAQQDAVFALSLPDGRIWLCQIHSGRPSGQEELLSSSLQACRRVDELRRVQDALQIWTDIEDIADRRPYTFDDLMLPPPGQSARVQAVAKESWLKRLPVSARLALALAVLAFLAMEGQAWWQNSQRLEIQRLAQAAQAAKEDQARTLWQSRLDTYLAEQAQQLDLSTLRSSLDRLPVVWQGWRLQSAKCTSTALALDKSSKKWRCTAIYNTPDVKLGQAFDANKRLTVPTGFEADFLPTKEVHLRWHAQTPAVSLSAQTLPDRQEHLVGTASLLQMNMISLANPPEIRFAPIDLVQPRHTDGTPALLPGNLRLPVKATITFKAPAAIADALVDRLKADWNTLTLTPAGEKLTGVDMEWTGVLHAKP
jgi:hypothetical protein